MSANTLPIFTTTPVVASGQINQNTTTALTRSDGSSATGIGTDMTLCFTAGSNGSWVSRIRVFGTAASPTTSTQSLLRLYISTQTSGAITAVNTWLIQEIPLSAIAYDNATTSVPFLEFPMNFAMPANYTILASIHATGNAVIWQIVTFAGNY